MIINKNWWGLFSLVLWRTTWTYRDFPWCSSRLIKRKLHHRLWRLPYTEVLVCHKQRVEVFHSNLSIERLGFPFIVGSHYSWRGSHHWLNANTCSSGMFKNWDRDLHSFVVWTISYQIRHASIGSYLNIALTLLLPFSLNASIFLVEFPLPYLFNLCLFLLMSKLWVWSPIS